MVAISKDYVANNALIDDDYDRVTLLVDQNKTLLNSLLRVSTQDELHTQHMKLDNLYLLIKLDHNIRCQINPQFTSYVSRVLLEIKLYETLQDNDITTNLKYFKLLNKGITVGDTLGLGYTNLQFDFIHKFFHEIIENCEYMIPSDSNYAKLIIEMLKYFMFVKDQNNENMLPLQLIQSMINIIRKLSNKLLYTINYKYITVSKMKLEEHKDLHSEMTYNITDNNIKNVITVPNPCVVENIYEIEAIQYSLVIITSKKNIDDLFKSISDDTDITVFIQSLLKHSNINLKCAALKYFLYPYFNSVNSWRDTKTIRQVMPFLLKIFDFKCIPWWFDPFDTLLKLMEIYNRKMPGGNPVVTFLKRTNLVHGFMELFFIELGKQPNLTGQQTRMTQFIHFFAYCSAFDENYRIEILKNNTLILQLKQDIKEHITLLQDFLSNVEMLASMTKEFPALYNSTKVVAWLELLRSFSRSTAALRTTLKRNNLTKDVMKLLDLTYKISKTCYFAGNDFLQSEIKVMGLSLGILCNFIVEFSNVQYFLTDQGIVDICGEILTDPLFNPKKNWINLSRKMAFEKINVEEVKTNTLWVIRHLMYNSQNKEKLSLLDKISIDTILDFVNDPYWSVQQQCFQVIKNLTCNSRKVINFLLERFKNVRYTVDPVDGSRVAVGSTYLFEFLARKLRLLDAHDLAQRKTLEAILYIIVNIAAVNENKKELVLEQTDILMVMHRILSEDHENFETYGNNSELKLACLWILHNILWDSNRPDDMSSSNLSSSQDDIDSTPESVHTSGHVIRDGFVGLDTERGRNVAPTHPSVKAVARCKRLQELGFCELVKIAATDSNINVRQKATNLDDNMFKLLDGVIYLD